MTRNEVCRHGLLTLERDGGRIHAHDGSRCGPPAPPPAPTTPEPPEWVSAPAPVPAAAPEPEVPPAAPEHVPPSRAPLAYETALASERSAPEVTEATPPAARRRRPWLLVGALVAAVVLLGGGVAGGLITRNAIDREKQRTAAAERRAATLRDEVATKDATIEDQRDDIAGYRQDQQQLRQREAELDEREKALETPDGPNATSFGDGIYQAHVAIQPGEYRTDGTEACYWAKLSTGDTNSILENGLVAGPQTVTVDSPYFESENCGTWTKVSSE